MRPGGRLRGWRDLDADAALALTHVVTSEQVHEPVVHHQVLGEVDAGRREVELEERRDHVHRGVRRDADRRVGEVVAIGDVRAPDEDGQRDHALHLGAEYLARSGIRQRVSLPL